MSCPCFAQHADEIGHALQRLLKRADIGDLRPDVDAHSSHRQIRLLRRLRVERPRLGNRHAELVLMQSGRNIRMSFRRNVRIHPHRDRRPFLQSRRGCRKQVQFRCAFNVEQQYPRAQGKFHLRRGFAHAGEHNLARGLPADAQNPFAVRRQKPRQSRHPRLPPAAESRASNWLSPNNTAYAGWNEKRERRRSIRARIIAAE